MFNHDHYVPILKWKRGERTALEQLDPARKSNMTPLIEVQPVPFNHTTGNFSKTIDDHLSDIGNHIKVAWDQNSPVFVDLYTLYNNEDFEDDILSNGQHPVEFVIDEIESNGTPAIPVTGIYRYQPFHDAIKSVSKKYNRGICLRLEEADLSDIPVLIEDLNNLLEFLEIEKEMVDIILDYKQILPQQEQEHLKNVILTIVQFPYLQNWRTLTLASTAYPKNLRQIPTNSSGSLPRTEWNVFQSLIGYGLVRLPAFGDYNISHPDFVNLDPRVINMAAGIKYTANNEFLIFRGIGIKNNGFSQMVQLCQNVINHQLYYGNHFSSGDQYIHDCAHQNVTTGNAEKWVTVGVNHHLTLVSLDLANLHVSSVVGSP
ncbi:beta family protein [Metabacillus sp. 22489]|uniref:beta family protein n=1 Tax=Metabacillus sp. 22489 TaxID=3453928 RepID=UPI003F865B09